MMEKDWSKAREEKKKRLADKEKLIKGQDKVVENINSYMDTLVMSKLIEYDEVKIDEVPKE